MDSDQQVYVLLSVFEKKIPVFYLGSKIFPPRTQTLFSYWQSLTEAL